MLATCAAGLALRALGKPAPASYNGVTPNRSGPQQYTPLFPLRPDATVYRQLTDKGVRIERLGDRRFLSVDRDAIRGLAEQAMVDIKHLLRPSHLAQLAAKPEDPEASENDRFLAFDLLKNANVAAGGVLPMCQDGTAIVLGKKGRMILTLGDDEAAVAEGIFDAYAKRNLRYSQLAPLSMYAERNTRSNLPAQIEILAEGESSYNFLFIAKGGGSANKTFLYQATWSSTTRAMTSSRNAGLAERTRLAAQRIFRIPGIAEFFEAQTLRIDQEDLTDQAFAIGTEPAERLADDLERHETADNSSERAEDAGFGAGRQPFGLREIREQAAKGRVGLAVGRHCIGAQSCQRAVVFAHRRTHQRPPLEMAGIGYRVTGRDIVGTVGDNIIGADQGAGIVRIEPDLVGDRFDMRVEPADGLASAFGLRAADVGIAVENLALQVGAFDNVVVDDTDRAEARRGQILDHGRTKAASPDDENLGLLKFNLARPADAAQNDMAGVAFDFFANKGHGRLSSTINRWGREA